MNKVLSNLSYGLRANKLCLNVQKRELIIFCPNNLKLGSSFKFKLEGKRLIPTQSVKCLGALLDEHLQCSKQLSHVKVKMNRSIGILSKLRYNSNPDILKIKYYSLFSSHLIHACQVWSQKILSSLNQIQILQDRAPRKKRHDFANPICKEFRILKFKDLIYLQNCLFMLQIENNI